MNVFKWLFGLELTIDHAHMLAEYNAMMGPIALGLATGHDIVESVSNVYATFGALLKESEIGQQVSKMSKIGAGPKLLNSLQPPRALPLPASVHELGQGAGHGPGGALA